MSEKSKWFLTEDQLKPKKKDKKARVVDPDKKLVTTKGIERILDMSTLTEPGRIKSGLFCSSIACDEYFDMRQEILDYFSPAEPRTRRYLKDMYTRQSNTKHSIIQDHLHSAGVLHPICTDENGDFKEPRAEFPELGLSGKIDLVLPHEGYLTALGAKTPKELPKISEYIVVDIKETSTANYVGIGQRLSQAYRGQLSLYSKFFEDNYGGPKRSAFLYLDRGDPKKFKYFEYTPEPKLLDIVDARAKTFWQHVNEKTLPEGDPGENKEVIEKLIELNEPDRKWKHIELNL